MRIEKILFKLLIFLLFSGIFFMQSCYYDKAWELMPVEPCDTTRFTYSGEVSPVLLQNCLPCHSTEDASAGVVIDTYEGVKAIVDDGRLLGVIRHEDGFLAMPKDLPQLDPCTIRIIELWVDAGAMNN